MKWSMCIAWRKEGIAGRDQSHRLGIVGSHSAIMKSVGVDLDLCHNSWRFLWHGLLVFVAHYDAFEQICSSYYVHQALSSSWL